MFYSISFFRALLLECGKFKGWVRKTGYNSFGARLKDKKVMRGRQKQSKIVNKLIGKRDMNRLIAKRSVLNAVFAFIVAGSISVPVRAMPVLSGQADTSAANVEVAESSVETASPKYFQAIDLFSPSDDAYVYGGASTVEMAALAKESDDENDNDPLESMNRLIFALNEILLDFIIDPISQIYTALVPETLRTGVSNVVDNLSTPVTVANSLLQGDPDRAMNAVGRFMVNTIAGVGGLVDVAAESGVPPIEEDFGQTLAVWGVDEGFYLVLPFFGPSNPRDAVGDLLVDGYFDPLGLWLDNIDQDDAIWARRGVGGLVEYTNVRDELKQIKKTSVDYYAAIRSLYRQKRRTEISNGNEIELPPIPELGYDLDPEDFNESLAGADHAASPASSN